MFQRGSFQIGGHLGKNELLRDNPAVTPTSCVVLTSVADDYQSVEITEIPGTVTDTGVRNLKNFVYLPLFQTCTAKRQSVETPGTGDKCVGLKRWCVGKCGKSHVKFQSTLVVADFYTDEATVFSFFMVVIFIQVRDKTFVYRQNGHFLFGVFYGSICKEEKRYDYRKAEE